ncbi:MAG: hypothetical protein WC335_09225 [Candidatus Omnitrophota bacterium]|jgi:hypothetical protein
MAKERFFHKLIRWTRSHPWLKLIALILAIMVWFYIRDEINRFNF